MTSDGELGRLVGGGLGGSGGVDILKDHGRLVGGSGKDDLGDQEKVTGKVGYGRRGRPTKNPRTNLFQLRLTKDEIDLLDLVSYATEDSKSDVIRKALKMYASVKKSAY